MLTHIVIWKYREEVEQEVREEHVTRLRGLSAIISEIISLSVGFDILNLPRSYDTGLVVVFRDRADSMLIRFIQSTSRQLSLAATLAPTWRRSTSKVDPQITQITQKKRAKQVT